MTTFTNTASTFSVEIHHEGESYWSSAYQGWYAVAESYEECVRLTKEQFDLYGWPENGVCFWGPVTYS